jgi:hypothetical protein
MRSMETPASTCICRPPASSAPKRSPAKSTPTGCERPRSATAIASKPMPARSPASRGQGRRAPGSRRPAPRAHPRCHGQHDDQRGAHARVARRIGVRAARAELEAQLGRGTAASRPHQQRAASGTRRHARAGWGRAIRADAAVRHWTAPIAIGIRPALALDPVEAQHVVEQSVGNEVEHDRRDHLMRAGRSAQIARDPGVEGARERPGQKRQRHQERTNGSPEKVKPEDHRRKPAHQELALRPDVEEPGGTPARGRARKHQRNGRRQRLGDRVERADRALQKRDVGPPDRRRGRRRWPAWSARRAQAPRPRRKVAR